MSSASRPAQLLLYLGIRFNGKQEMATYHRITSEQFRTGTLPPTDPLYFKPNKSVRHSMMGAVGSVYVVEHEPGAAGTIFPSSATWHGQWPDALVVTEWTARHHAARADRIAEKARKQHNAFNAIKEQVEPLRIAYQKLPAPLKAQFLAQMVNYLTRG